MSITFFSALFLELEFAIFSGVLLSLILYLDKVSKPRMVSRVPDPRLTNNAFTTDPELPQCPQLRFLRIDGSLFFGSINHVEETLGELETEYPEQKHLAIIAKSINFADLTGGEVLLKEAQRRRARGGNLYLINLKQGLWDSLEKGNCIEEIGVRNMFQTKTAAITGIFQKLDKSVCSTCTQRIFKECKSVPFVNK